MSIELRTGYKRTEVGMIPMDWEPEPLCQIGRWFSGGTPSLANASYWSGDIPWISPKDMKSPRLWDAIDHISLKAVSDGARVLPVGAILMVIRGMILAHSFPVARVESPSAFNQDVKALVTRSDIDSNFILFWLTANKQRLRSLTTESTHGTKRLPSEILFREIICLPPLPEQRAIAAALSDVDDLLAKLDTLLAKKRDLKQAAMQQLLTGKIRLPGFIGEWESKRLGQVLLVRHGKNQHHIVANDGKYPILASGGEIGRTNTYLYNRPSVLIGRKGTIDKPQYQDAPFWTVDTLFYTELANTIYPKFIYYKFLMIDWRSYNEASGVPSLNAATIGNIEISIPGLIEQIAIATILSDMDADLAALEARRDKTCALKQGMMQELLTGRIRLVSADDKGDGR